jgi:glycosyltransferase involved in cell wall biosynthesis
VDTDFGIALHAGDSARLKLHYGREADHLLPITLDPPVLLPARELATGPATALFVGSLFRPNVEAIAFLHAEVAPHSPLPIVVAGRRTEELRSRFPDNERFRIVGSVPDLRPLYAQAAVVLSPVSIGGGMKVKNIEALAHGKRVICTPHAAAGLEEEVRRGWVVLAEDAESFAAAMGRQSNRPGVAAEAEIAGWFSSHYSTTARGPGLRAFLQARMERHTGPEPTSNE